MGKINTLSRYECREIENWLEKKWEEFKGKGYTKEFIAEMYIKDVNPKYKVTKYNIDGAAKGIGKSWLEINNRVTNLAVDNDKLNIVIRSLVNIYKIYGENVPEDLQDIFMKIKGN
jgi:hypothetical protein